MNLKTILSIPLAAALLLSGGTAPASKFVSIEGGSFVVVTVE